VRQERALWSRLSAARRPARPCDYLRLEDRSSGDIGLGRDNRRLPNHLSRGVVLLACSFDLRAESRSSAYPAVRGLDDPRARDCRRRPRVAGGIVADVTRWWREPRDRRRRRSEDAALRAQETLARLTLDLSRLEAGEDYLLAEVRPFLEELLNAAALITDVRVRRTVRLISYVIEYGDRVTKRVIDKKERTKESGWSSSLARVLTVHGLDVIGAYLRGDGWIEPGHTEGVRDVYNKLAVKYEIPRIESTSSAARVPFWRRRREATSSA
jgi:hypothetical protein